MPKLSLKAQQLEAAARRFESQARYMQERMDTQGAAALQRLAENARKQAQVQR